MNREERREQIEKQKSFCQAMEKVAHKLKKEIEKKNTICIPVKDLAKDMEPKFEIKDITQFYFRTRQCLWDNGIHIEPKTKDHEHTLLMRTRTPDDVWWRSDHYGVSQLKWDTGAGGILKIKIVSE